MAICFGAYLIGWIDTDEAKVDRYWRADKNGWSVPRMTHRSTCNRGTCWQVVHGNIA